MLSETNFSTQKDCETTKAFLLSGNNWCYILPTAPPGCIIKNESQSGWEMYEKEGDTHTFFVQSERKIEGNCLSWKMTKTSPGGPMFCVNSRYDLKSNSSGGTDIHRQMYNYKKIAQGGPDFSQFLPKGALSENDNIVKYVNMSLLSLTNFCTSKDCETTKAFLLKGENWCKILPTAPPGCIIKNETDDGWEMYENEGDTNTFFVQSERKIDGNCLSWKMTKTANGNNVFCVNSIYELSANDQGGTDICRKMCNYTKFAQGGPDFSKFLPKGAISENENI